MNDLRRLLTIFGYQDSREFLLGILSKIFNRDMIKMIMGYITPVFKENHCYICGNDLIKVMGYGRCAITKRVKIISYPDLEEKTVFQKKLINHSELWFIPIKEPQKLSAKEKIKCWAKYSDLLEFLNFNGKEKIEEIDNYVPNMSTKWSREIVYLREWYDWF